MDLFAHGATTPASAHAEHAPATEDWNTSAVPAQNHAASTPTTHSPAPAALGFTGPGARDEETAPGAAAASIAAPLPATAPNAPMDRDFIARNQIVERYLSGRLPLKGATDFERFCRDNPEALDDIGLAERVNAGLRLLEASGKPEPWQDKPRPFWQKPPVTIGLAIAVLILGSGVGIMATQDAANTQKIAKLQRQIAERPLDPASSTREIRLMPSREGASNTPAITLYRNPAQLADLKIDESRSPFKVFRVTIDRIDQGRVGVINYLAKDSNGHLRIALNSSAFGPGNYQLTIEGVTWRGDTEPDSWITIGIQH